MREELRGLAQSSDALRRNLTRMFEDELQPPLSTYRIEENVYGSVIVKSLNRPKLVGVA
jgi:hypothetical protein